MNNITTEEQIKNAIIRVKIMCSTCGKKIPAAHDCGTCCVIEGEYSNILKFYKTEFRGKLDRIVEAIGEWKLNTMVSMDDVKREIDRIKNSL